MSAGLVVECCKGYISTYLFSVFCEYHGTNVNGTEYQNAKRKFQNMNQDKAESKDKVGSPAPDIQHRKVAD